MARGFIDSFFSLLRPARTSPSKSIGVGGTAVYGGYIHQNEKDARLIGRERYKTFSEILVNTTILGAAVRLFLNTVSKPSWRAEPAEDNKSGRAVELAERVEEALLDMTTPWYRVVRRAAMFNFHGFSIQEWTSKRRDDGMIGFLDVEPRPQQTIEKWDLDESGTVAGVVQLSPQDFREIYLPRNRIVLATDDAISDSPEGLGIFRHIVNAARRLQRYEQLEGMSFEMDLRGIPIGRGPFKELQDRVDAGDLTPEKKLAYEEGLRRFVKDHVRTENMGVLLDSATYQTTDEVQAPSAIRQWDIELLTAQSNGHEAVAAAIERVNREIARVVGAEHLLLGATSTGSLALSKDKTTNFVLIIESVLRELVAVYESDLVDRLFEMNGWPMELRPSLKVDTLQSRDIEVVTGALRDLAQASAAVGPQDEAYMEIFDHLGLTRPKLEDHMGQVILNDPTHPQNPMNQGDPANPNDEGDSEPLPKNEE